MPRLSQAALALLICTVAPFNPTDTTMLASAFSTRSSLASVARRATSSTAAPSIRSLSSSLKSTAEETETEKPAPPTVVPNSEAYSKLKMDDVVSLCKRRGIIFPSSEIYNGFAGFFDYGPLGAELKKNVKDAWWRTFVTRREDVVGLDSSIIHNPTTWKSSGELWRLREIPLMHALRNRKKFFGGSQRKMRGSKSCRLELLHGSERAGAISLCPIRA